MANDDLKSETLEGQEVTWSSKKRMRSESDRRENHERRQFSGRAITVPDMRSGLDRRAGEDRRKVRLTITGRAIDV